MAAEIIVCFGCAVDGRGHPTPALTRRLETTLALARAHPAASVLLSGGSRAGRPPEAFGMAAWLATRAVAETRLIREAESRYTRENAALCAAIVATMRPDRLWLVTEGFHLRRSTVLLRRALQRRGVQISVAAVAAPDGLGRAARAGVAALEAGKLARDLAAAVLMPLD